MPIHVDINVNTVQVQRFHIARMSHGGLQPDSINEYSVVVLDKEPVFKDTGVVYEFRDEPTWLEWEQGTRFMHRYGDDVMVCVQKALTAHLNK